jgi:hypothetical protein
MAFIGASHAAVLLGDVEALRADAEWYAESGYPAAWYERSWRTVEAGRAALEERVDESLNATV